MLKYFLLTLIFIFIYSCSESEESLLNVPTSSNVEDLIRHTEEFKQQILTYDTPGGKIHFAIGFGIANSIMIEGEDSNIIIDASDSVYEAEKIYSLFYKRNSNPIDAIIYTHNHGDHTFGASYFYNLQEKKPKIIAHEDTDYYVQRILGILNPIISLRSSRMFGMNLPDDDLINVGIGGNISVSKSPTGYVKPDLTFKDNLELNISGVEIKLFHAPGETNDQIFVWLPNHKALMPGDNIYKTFPNLYTIRGTTHRDVIGWINSLDHMKTFNAEFVFPSHTKPIIGEDKIKDTLTVYRDAIQFVHDQTIRYMNEGLYPDQIIQLIELPNSLKKSPYLYEFYGTVRWSIKSIFSGYLGWFSGNPSELDPLSRDEKAKRVSKLAGGNDMLLKQLNNAVNDNDMQWALELSDYLISLNYLTEDVKQLRIKALIYEGSRASNPNKRNYFLSSAYELTNKIIDTSLPRSFTDEFLNQISLDTLFGVLSTRFDPEKHNGVNYSTCFKFNSGFSKNIVLRNSVAVVSSDKIESCDLNIKLDEILFKKILVGDVNPVTSIGSNDIEIEGSTFEFLNFLLKFQ